ncbi:integrin alpha-IIb [Denticeps clupeoides]|uniref:Integrin alpha-2 domain-containing protein n=1 Tax=Denticeps clupeoides TaxID=299321 RepID=A0AAY4AP23_9TELE|nr:integrin alpha-IIb-like [Denticeps clupeoides]
MKVKRRCREVAVFSWLFFTALPILHSLNIDLSNYTVFSGPEGSYFGFSVDFYHVHSQSIHIVVGAPKANSSQAGVHSGGSVFLCLWSMAGGACDNLEFDPNGDEVHRIADLILKGSKSNQWFGASVRAKDNYIVACAPLFHWNVINSYNDSQNTPVGNCFVKNILSGEVSTYSPCRDAFVEHYYAMNAYNNDKRYCEVGFCSEITKEGKVGFGAPGSLYFQGQIITATLEEIMKIAKTTQPLASKWIGKELKYSMMEQHLDMYAGYSVSTGNLTGGRLSDFLVGLPNDRHTAGTVRIYNENLSLKMKFNGLQVASYYGHSVAVTDVNNDGRDDVLIGAPLFIEHQHGQQLREVGQVYLHLQLERFKFNSRPDQTLTGSYIYGRFGSSIAQLGDLDKDGFNDIAVGAPSAGGDGRVFIYMGKSTGLSEQYVQVLESPFHSINAPAAFGFTLRGGMDVDGNGYPDLVVGAWGANKIAVYRALTVVNAKAQLTLFPDFLNPEDKTCELPMSKKPVSCFTVMMCMSVSGHQIPPVIDLNAELQLDRMKQMLARRTLLLESSQPQHHFKLRFSTQAADSCTNVTAYLREEFEFKDKLSPIFISVNYSLGSTPGAILHGQPAATAQTRIILDCGEDNICEPDLKLSATAETERLLIGDDNPALLIVEAENGGEGAYETELQIVPPANTHFQGMSSDTEGFTRLTCKQKKDNMTVVVVCDLGNPMKTGQKIKAGMLFSLVGLEEVERDVHFKMQIKSKNSLNPDSNIIHLRINVSASATLQMQGGSSPVECVLPIPNWEAEKDPRSLEEVGPYVEHVYMLKNLGPSTVNAKVEMEFPTHWQRSLLLYAFAIDSENFFACYTNQSGVDMYEMVREEKNFTLAGEVHHLNKRDTEMTDPQDTMEQKSQETVHVNCSSGDPCLKVVCEAEGLQRQGIAVVRVMARLWVQNFLENPNENFFLHSVAYYQVESMHSKIQPHDLPRGQAETQTSVVWKEEKKDVPVWWIVAAIIAGLLLLALLSYIFWKVGFFKRNRPPCEEDDEDAQNLNAAENEGDSVQQAGEM